MKKLFFFFLMVLFITVDAQKLPQKIKSEFTPEALSQKMISLDGKKLTVAEILKPYEGKVLIIDFWASWCRDCILALPKTDELKNTYPEVEFVYFSLDRSHEQWKRGLEKHGIADRNNFWFDEGWKNTFNDYIELNWVPRFIVVDQTGKIADYYAVSPEDQELLDTVKKLTAK